MKRKNPDGMIHNLTFLGVIAVIGILSLFLPKPEKSDYEGRELVKFPDFSWKSFFSGEFTRQISTHFSDTFPMREKLVEAAAVYKNFMGLNIDNVKIHGSVPEKNDGIQTEEDKQYENISQTENQEDQTSSVSQKTEDNDTIEMDGEMKDGVFIAGDKAMSLFGGSDAVAKQYANIIKDYKEQFGNKVKVYSMVVPTQAEFALPKKYQSLSNSQKDSIDYIYSMLSPSVITIDAYSELKEHKNEYVYFRTDHHWTPLGAYYGYEAFCKAMNFEPVPLADMEKKTKENFVGSLYRITQEPALKQNPDHMDYYIVPKELECYYYKKESQNTPVPAELYVEYAEGVNTYSLFMGGDWPLFEINSNAGMGRSILVVKESFGNALIPFLANHYDKVYVVDQRYFKKNLVKFVSDNNIEEVMFLNNVFAANTKSQANWIKNLKYDQQWAVTTIPATVQTTIQAEEQMTQQSDETEVTDTQPITEADDIHTVTEESSDTLQIPVIPSEESYSE